jgi:hypothetical protein
MEQHCSKWISFQEIMAYHPDNQRVYNEIKKRRGHMIPFVGAGLSLPFYPLWGESLRQLAQKLTSEKDREHCEAMIAKGRYMDAAELLARKRGREKLNLDFAELFSSEKLEKTEQKLRRQAIYLLPALFPGCVLTTNLDCLLEKVYAEDWKRPFDNHFLPGERPSLQSEAMQNPNAHFLLSLHGSVETKGERIEGNSVVFTRRQYIRHYWVWSPLVKTMRRWFQNRSMLFLGCSLNRDRTMRVLRSASGRGSWHYAIVNAAPEERDAKLLELERMHIQAIVFPTGRFESVRVVLEKLLEETDQALYENLTLQMSNVNRDQYRDRFFAEKDLFMTVGRDAELQELKNFVDDAAAFRWWAITGPASAGKSRLAWELTKQLPKCWTSQRICGEKTMRGLSAFSHPDENKVYVAEDVQAYADELGDWIQEMAQGARGSAVRLLLVERSGGDWEERLRRRLEGCPAAEEAEYRTSKQQGFLKLEPLKEDSLWKLIGDYAEAVLPLSEVYTRRELPDAQDRRQLIDALKRVDGHLLRPIYLLFLTDAWLRGEEPSHWTSEDLLNQHVLGNERKLLRTRIEKYTGKDRCDTLLIACLTLWRAATLLPDEELSSFLPEDWKLLDSAAKIIFQTDALQLLTRLGLETQGRLAPMRPDILGELFILNPAENRVEEHARLRLLRQVWRRPQEALPFFLRLISDYQHQLDKYPDKWSKLLPELETLSSEAIVSFAKLLEAEASLTESITVAELTVSQLEKLEREWAEKATLSQIFAKALCELIKKEDAEESAATVNRLEDLFKEKSTDPEITLCYANGLCAYSEKMKLAERFEIAARLETLSMMMPDDHRIALAYAESLLLLAKKQFVIYADESITTINRLEKLTLLYQNDFCIILKYAQCLEQLAFFSPGYNAMIADNVIAKFEYLYQKWSGKIELAVQYSAALKHIVHYSCDLTSNTKAHIRARNNLITLHAAFPFNETIALHYADILSKINYKQNISDDISMMEHLDALSQTWFQNTEIGFMYARLLRGLAIKYKKDNVADIFVRRFEQLVFDCFPKDRKLLLLLANTYFFLLESRLQLSSLRSMSDWFIELTALRARSFSGEFSDKCVYDVCELYLEAADMYRMQDHSKDSQFLIQLDNIVKNADIIGDNEHLWPSISRIEAAKYIQIKWDSEQTTFLNTDHEQRKEILKQIGSITFLVG